MPNETWQSDFTHYRLRHAGTDTRDPHLARRLLPLRPARHRPPRVTGTDRARHLPRNRRPARHPRLHPDRQRHGLHHPPRRRGRRGGRNAFEIELRPWDVIQKNSRPNHPTTCGKVERFQQTLKNWLRQQPNQPTTIAELQTLIDAFVEDYNHHRPHRSLPHRATPAALYNEMPKALPGPPATPTPTTGSATTASTSPAPSPCASTANSTTSASDEPTTEPTSSCSSRTSTSASSTPSPANSSASSPSTPARTTSHAPRNDKHPNPRFRGFGCRRCPETSHGRADSVLVQDIGNGMSQDIGNRCVGSSAWLSAECRKPAWSSPLSSSRAAPRPRSPHLRRLPGLGLRARGPLPRRGRGRVRAALTAPEDLTRPPPQPATVELILGSATSSPSQASTPAPTPSPGTSQHHHHTRRLAGHDQPHPDPRRTGHPGPEETTQVLLHPLRSRACPTRPGRPTSPTTASPTGTDVEILTWLDDHSRYALLVTAHRRVTGPDRARHLPQSRMASTASRPPP